MTAIAIDFCLLCCQCMANHLTRVLEHAYGDEFISEQTYLTLGHLRELEKRLRARKADLG